MKNNIFMTINGEKKLKEELHFLKNVKRPKIIQEIYEARKYGDLKENSEYKFAKEQQIFYENKIKEIEKKLFNAIIIDITKININDRVVFGSTIFIENISNNLISNYCIVGEEESNIKENKISIYSPIAKGFIGKKVGCISEINIPNGIVKYKLLEIKYI